MAARQGATNVTRPAAEGPIDPCTGLVAEVRLIQPYEARKRYRCPGCNQDIEAGTAHLVVVPLEAVDLRRHWHRPCFTAGRRPTGRQRPSRGG